MLAKLKSIKDFSATLGRPVDAGIFAENRPELLAALAARVRREMSHEVKPLAQENIGLKFYIGGDQFPPGRKLSPNLSGRVLI